MLTVINGPMFSGKTSRLIAMANANLVAGNKIKIYKPSNDTRSAGELITHDGISVSAEVIDKNSLFVFVDNQAEIILFDEAQFFNKEKFGSLISLLLEWDCEVICAGLSQDFDGCPFGAMPELLSRADEIINLKAVCSKCKGINIATRTFRRGDSTEQVVVGGKELYEARCFKCWMEDE